MIDIHSHIMYGIDDGSKDIETSIEILKEAKKEGITDIFLTPHYIENSKYNTNNKKKNELLKKLQKQIEKENLDINLYIGNEIYINESIIEYIKNKEISSLNNSKYILVELPMGKMYQNTKHILFNLIRNGYIVILAHPERYIYLKNHDEVLDEFLSMGVLLQGNYRSLFGYYGRDAKKALKKYIKRHQISFLGSDIHENDGYMLEKLEKKILKISKDEVYTKNILEENARCIIKNENLK